MVESPLRIGILGAGGIAVQHGIAWTAPANAARATITAVADVSAPRARDFAERWSGGRAARYDDFAALMADPNVDVVDVCLPHHLHTPAIIAAARAGKAILCEKPLCTSLADAAAIDAALRETGVTFVMGHNQLFQPSLIEARRLLATGGLGRPYVYRSIECFQNRAAITGQAPPTLPPGESPWAWRNDPARMGGGEVLDTGWHASYRLLALTGDDRPVEVTATLDRFFLPDLPTEDTGLLLVRFASGALGEILTTWAFMPVGGWQFEVMAEHGSLAGNQTTLLHQVPRWPEPAAYPNAPVHTFTEVASHFLDVVLLGVPSLAPFPTAARVLQLTLAAYESAKLRRPVALPDDPLRAGVAVDG